MSLASALSRYREGGEDGLSFREFVRATERDFRQMARYLMNRYRVPSWFDVDDVAQELYASIPRCVTTYEPGYKGVTLLRYVVFNAMAYAKRELHRARGAPVGGDADNAPSRIDVPFSSLSKSSGDGLAWADVLAIVGPDEGPETILQRKQDRAEAARDFRRFCEDPHEARILKLVVVEGEFQAAGQILSRSRYGQVECGLRDEATARRHALSVMSRVARRRERHQAA